MAGAPTPQVLLEAIAANAPVGPLPGNKTAPMPETPPVTPNAASIQSGFPAIVMTNENAGGKPPLGPDMNGLWFLVSSHTLYVECGQTYKYNNNLATAIGGYAAGTILGMTDNLGLWLNLVDGNTSDPDAGGAGWVPQEVYGFRNVDVTGGTVNLSAAQSKYGVIVLNGILTSNLIVNFPTRVQQWLVINRTSGAFTTTAKTATTGSSGQVIPQGGFAGPFGIYSIGDGNIYPTVPPLGVAIDQNPTPLSLVERTNAGYVIATYLVQTSALEPTTFIRAVFGEATTGDGLLRKIPLTQFEAQLLLQGFAGQVTNGQVPFSVVAQWAAALFTNAALTGTSTAPTASPGTSNTQIATTEFANPGVIINGNGVCLTLPSQYKIQMGTVTPAGGSAVITFPVPFLSSVFGPWGINISGGPTQVWLPAAPTLNAASIANTGGSTFWIAVGK